MGFGFACAALDLLSGRNILLAHSVMAKDTLITTVDSHTAGEPTRVITEGLPTIPGDTIGEQMAYFRENLDHIRTALLHEPRGHRHLVGAVVLPSTRSDADFGAFYLDHSRCFGMCGHATIGIGVTLLKTGRIEAVEPETKVILDTPAGLVTIRLGIEDGRAVSGTLTNVPCFLHTKDILVSFEDQSLSVDMAFGGSFFVVARAEDLGVEIRPDTISELARYSSLIAREVSKSMTPTHPEYDGPEYDGPGYESLVYFHGDARGSSADFRSLAVGGGRKLRPFPVRYRNVRSARRTLRPRRARPGRLAACRERHRHIVRSQDRGGVQSRRLPRHRPGDYDVCLRHRIPSIPHRPRRPLEGRVPPINVNELVSILFSLAPIALAIGIGIWRRRQIYRQEERDGR